MVILISDLIIKLKLLVHILLLIILLQERECCSYHKSMVLRGYYIDGDFLKKFINMGDKTDLKCVLI